MERRGISLWPWTIRRNTCPPWRHTSPTECLLRSVTSGPNEPIWPYISFNGLNKEHDDCLTLLLSLGLPVVMLNPIYKCIVSLLVVYSCLVLLTWSCVHWSSFSHFVSRMPNRLFEVLNRKQGCPLYLIVYKKKRLFRTKLVFILLVI